MKHGGYGCARSWDRVGFAQDILSGHLPTSWMVLVYFGIMRDILVDSICFISSVGYFNGFSIVAVLVDSLGK